MLREAFELGDGHSWPLEVFSRGFGKRRTAQMRKSGPRIPRRMRRQRSFLGYLSPTSTQLVIQNISWITCASVW
jgi:hypothetical protein